MKELGERLRRLREQRQRLIDSFVNAVYLYEDKIILTFNYKDGSKTITLAEVEGSDLSVLGAVEQEKSGRQDLNLFKLLLPAVEQETERRIRREVFGFYGRFRE